MCAIRSECGNACRHIDHISWRLASQLGKNTLTPEDLRWTEAMRQFMTARRVHSGLQCTEALPIHGVLSSEYACAPTWGKV